MGEEPFCCSSLGAVDYVPLGVAMIHFLMKIEGGNTRANFDGFGARLVR